MLLRREQIRWEQLDPRITARVGAHLAQTRSSDASAIKPSIATIVPENSRETMTCTVAGEKLEPTWTVLSFLGALFIVFLYLNACFNLIGPVATTMLSALPVGLAGIGTMAGIVEGGKTGNTPRLRGRIVSLDSDVRRAFSRSATTRAEELYSEVVLLLAAGNPVLRKPHLVFRQDLLRQCNALLADHFRIVEHRQRLHRLMDNGNALVQVEREAARLRARRDGEADPVARRSYAESLEMCEERLETVRGLPSLISRLDAHDELICQALSLARAALARVEAAPVALGAPDVEGLRTTVRRVLHQTRAVEEAVVELNEHSL